jgi:hypothetical protein
MIADEASHEVDEIDSARVAAVEAGEGV